MLALVLLASVAPSGGCKAHLAHPERTRSVQWGEPVDGLQAGLAVNHYRSDRKAWLGVTYAIRNAGETPLRVMGLRHYAGNTRFFPTRGPLIVKARGQKAKWIAPQDEPPPPESAYDLLEPGQQATVRGGIDPGHYRLGGTFDAELTFVYEVHPPPSDTAPEGAVPVWTGRAESPRVRARVSY
jgi:hypothetical protein